VTSDARDLEGRSVLAAHARIDLLDWIVFVEQPQREAFAPLYASVLRNGLLIAAGCRAGRCRERVARAPDGPPDSNPQGECGAHRAPARSTNASRYAAATSWKLSRWSSIAWRHGCESPTPASSTRSPSAPKNW